MGFSLVWKLFVKTMKMIELYTWALFPKCSVFESTVFEQEQHLIDGRSI